MSSSFNKPTVVEQYSPKRKQIIDSLESKDQLLNFQSEADLENKLIEQLKEQNYEYLIFDNKSKSHEEQLIDNLRKQIEKLNDILLTDGEWDRLLNEFISPENKRSVLDQTERLQNNYIYDLTLDNGNLKNIRLIDKQNINKNCLQVINQFVNNEGKYQNRYDVTILVNGLPLVHIELKKRGVNLKEAFYQMQRYKQNSFGAGKGLFNYIQIFIISNGTSTKYYANTVLLNEKNGKEVESKVSRSFQFTMHWTDQKNVIIEDLFDFAKEFLDKNTILNILTKYCIFTTEKKLIVMRPYQIAATEKIVNKVIKALDNNQMGSIDAGGYIWHTTGSGKTITSFKTAQIINNLDNVDKVLFVVDRKDLDYQTIKEYQKLDEDCVKANNDIKTLQKQLLNEPNRKIIVTTIQKLSRLINNKDLKNQDIVNKNIVIIFDECHRSQFGKMHNDIIHTFNKYAIFGFTGTPIFSQNAHITSSREIANNLKTNQIFYKTTEEIFGERLHTYSIVNAIEQETVLKFKYDFVKTIEGLKDDISDEMVSMIDEQTGWNATERIAKVTSYIIDNFKHYTRQVDRQEGFNSILAVSGIEQAKEYYKQFKKQLLERELHLKIATIFSYAQNEQLKDYDEQSIDDENNDSADDLDESSRSFLDEAIKDYNQLFKTSYDSSSSKFNNYYKDISKRMKNKEIDILIVVNMFLTGFDAPCVNTLWIDKWVRMHGLLQAFSRTNRIFNSLKPCGQIISFRPLKTRMDQAICLFSNQQAVGKILLREFNDYYNGYLNSDGYRQEGYVDIVNELKANFSPEIKIFEDSQKVKFLKLFNSFLQLYNILKSFDEFSEEKQIITGEFLQDYLSRYYEYSEDIRKVNDAQKVNIANDLVYEAELMQQFYLSLDYIFEKINHEMDNIEKDMNITQKIIKIINSQLIPRNKKELLLEFIHSINDFNNISLTDFNNFLAQKRVEKFNEIVKKYDLIRDKTKNFFQRCVNKGRFIDYGADISNLKLRNGSFFDVDYKNNEKHLIEELKKFYDDYCTDIS